MNGKILVGMHEGVFVIRFVGDVRVTLTGSFDHYIGKILSDPDFSSVLIDLNDAVAIDSTSLGGLAKLSLSVQERRHRLPTLVCSSPDILRVLRNMGFDDIFAIVDEQYLPDQSLAVLPVPHDMSEDEMRARVIDAHKVLMDMNETNQATFRDLVKALEAEDEAARKREANPAPQPVVRNCG